MTDAGERRAQHGRDSRVIRRHALRGAERDETRAVHGLIALWLFIAAGVHLIMAQPTDR